MPIYRPINQKPPKGARLTRAHPLSRGLRVALLMNEGSGAAVWDYAANKFRVAEHLTFPVWNGLSLDFTTADDHRVHIGEPSLVGRVDKTIMVICAVDVDQSNNIFMETTATAFHNYPIYTNTTDRFFYFLTTGSTPITYGQIYTVISQHLALGSHVRGFLDGKIDLDWYDIADLNTSAVEFCIGSRDPDTSGTGYPFDGRMYACYVWDRVLSTGECQWVSREPYAMFEQPRRVKYFIPAAVGGNPTITISETLVFAEALD